MVEILNYHSYESVNIFCHETRQAITTCNNDIYYNHNCGNARITKDCTFQKLLITKEYKSV